MRRWNAVIALLAPLESSDIEEAAIGRRSVPIEADKLSVRFSATANSLAQLMEAIKRIPFANINTERNCVNSNFRVLHRRFEK